ncbi:MAG: flagellar export protein FliJ [Ruminococcaceae bacterium]|nr:flagellar export protein FliJ [Oscillospiraceae bacterium]HHV31923.1 flagellar export protein FliJ [Clostridiales bacterium]
MKKFIFSLEKVLGFKQQTLDVKKNELSAMQSKLHELEQEIDDLNRKFTLYNQQMVEAMKEGLSASDISVYKMYFNVLNKKIKKLIEEKSMVLDLISHKKDEIVQVNSEISGFEKLRDKQFAEYMKQVQKSQELAIEEFVSQVR